MAQWMIMNLDTGAYNGKSIINKKQLNQLWTPHNNFEITEASKVSMPGRHFNGYGLGWSLNDYYGTLMASHGGGYDGMYSKVLMVPDLKLGIVVLTNTMQGISTPISYYIVNQYLKKDLRDWSQEYLKNDRGTKGHQAEVEQRKKLRVMNTSPSVKTSEFTGEYFDPMYGTISIFESDGKLQITFADAPALDATLSHWHHDTYLIEWKEEHAWFDFGTVAIITSNNLRVKGLRFDVPNGDIFFHELNPEKVK
jgi:hypothetical protein